MISQEYYNGLQYFLSLFSAILGIPVCIWNSPLYGHKVDASNSLIAFRSEKIQLKNHDDFSVCVFSFFFFFLTRGETFSRTILLLLQTSKHVSYCQSLSCGLTLCNPVTCSPPGSSVHGILQARILEWVTILFSRPDNFIPRLSARIGSYTRFSIDLLEEELNFYQGVRMIHIELCKNLNKIETLLAKNKNKQ